MTIKQLKIQDREVGPGCGCFIIAEMGLAHDGNFQAACDFIDAIAGAGADAVKFQTHIAEAEGTLEEKFRVKVFKDKTRQDYWKRTAFTETQWHKLKQLSDDKGLIFLSSPFSNEAFQLLNRVGVPAWKIASGETNNYPLIEEIAKTGCPLLVSTGMSRIDEIDHVVRLIEEKNVPMILYQCTNRYPCPPEHLGLNMIQDYRRRYNIPVGFSDHSGKIATGIAAYVLGACSVEVHVTFNRQDSGPDIAASLTVNEFAQMVESIRFLEHAIAAPVVKDQEAEEMSEMRLLFTKSIVASRDLKAGVIVKASDIALKKPGTGMPAGELESILGRILKRNLNKDEKFSPEDVK